jgi:hypothetical protein
MIPPAPARRGSAIGAALFFSSTNLRRGGTGLAVLSRVRRDRLFLFRTNPLKVLRFFISFPQKLFIVPQRVEPLHEMLRPENSISKL